MFTLERFSNFFETFIDGGYIFTILDGLYNTLLLSLIATIIGLAIGLVVAVIGMLESKGTIENSILKVLKIIAKVYVDIIRGTPAVVQVSFLWLVVLAPLNLPRVMVGGIAFGINSGAYMSEVIRGGITSIDRGQTEAGRSLGLSYFQTMHLIILPQAFRQMLPSLVNEFINLIKETAIIGFIGGMDLMKAANILISTTYNFEIPLIMVALIYLTITSILTYFMRGIENKLSKQNR
ncbi:amino acid ABC transporter permease [Candidatus Epulonipiscium viviparus]|uniref:amino acid ABC transporter permease n=1 Tax=Candidatus Epulonipiscium viviparus TaxID=420336 RepID=UPI00016C01F0|nr:amino acid ABC transporter permease [Candidatus Epulopiscium viviparus]